MGASSDGDPKLLAAMCAKMCGVGKNLIVTQDHIHFANKCKNRLLKEFILFPMGNFEVSIKHLQSLVKDVQKSVHDLSQIDVCPIDRMNYDSFLKKSLVIEQSKHYRNTSSKVMPPFNTSKYYRDATSSFLKVNLSPTERIFNIWHSLFFTRIWRNYIKPQSDTR